MSIYRLPKSVLLIGQFKTRQHTKAFNIFVLGVKKWALGADILQHIEHYMLYDEDIHTYEYAIDNKLQEVLKCLLVFKPILNVELAYNTLIKGTNYNKDIFRTLFENPELLEKALEWYDIYNVDDWTIERPKRVELLHDTLLKAAVQVGNLQVLAYLINDINVSIVRDPAPEWAFYYNGDPIEIDAVVYGQYHICIYLIKIGADAEMIYDYANRLRCVGMIIKLHPYIFDELFENVYAGIADIYA